MLGNTNQNVYFPCQRVYSQETTAKLNRQLGCSVQVQKNILCVSLHPSELFQSSADMSLNIPFYCSNPNFQGKKWHFYPFLSCPFPSSKLNSFSHLSMQDRTLVYDSTALTQIMYCLNIFLKRTAFPILLPKSRLLRAQLKMPALLNLLLGWLRLPERFTYW